MANVRGGNRATPFGEFLASVRWSRRARFVGVRQLALGGAASLGAGASEMGGSCVVVGDSTYTDLEQAAAWLMWPRLNTQNQIPDVYR